jgi:hypothetical protein
MMVCGGNPREQIANQGSDVRGTQGESWPGTCRRWLVVLVSQEIELVEVTHGVAVVLPFFVQEDVETLEHRMVTVWMARIVRGGANICQFAVGESVERGLHGLLVLNSHREQLIQVGRRGDV